MRKNNIGMNIDRVHIRYFINMLPILVIPIFIMIMIYYRSNEIILEQTYETNLAVLKNSAETVQKTFRDMDKLFVYIGESPSINRVLESINPLKDGATTPDLLRLHMDDSRITFILQQEILLQAAVSLDSIKHSSVMNTFPAMKSSKHGG